MKQIHSEHKWAGNRWDTTLFWILVLIALAVLVVYWPCLQNGLTSWDDDNHLTENPEVLSLTLQNIGTIFTSFRASLYKPLTTFSYALEYHFFGMNPRVFHTTNVLLHVLNSFLVWLWMRRLSIRPWAALVAALVFALHPMKVESVAWVAERKDVLFAAFYLGALIQYENFKQTGRRSSYALSGVFHLFSCLAKSVAITLPVILLLVDFVQGRTMSRKSILEKIPYFLISLGVGYVAMQAGTVDQKVVHDVMRNIFFSGYGVGSYFLKFLFPWDLCAIYRHPQNVMFIHQMTAATVWTTAFLIFFERRKNRTLFFSVFFFLVAILPNIQLIPSRGNILVADRYIYLPSLGILYGVARMIQGRKEIWLKPLCVVLIICLGVVSWHRCHIWKSSVTLWTDVARGDPSCGRAYYNRAIALQKEGKVRESLMDYNRALTMDPGDLDSLMNRGNIYREMNRLDEALVDYSRALELSPRDPRSWLNKGNILALKGDMDDAIIHYKKALEINPSYGAVYNNWGLRLLKMGKKGEAIPLFLKAVQVEPTLWQSYLNLGNCAMDAGDYEAAIEYFQKGLLVNPKVDSLLHNLVVAQRELAGISQLDGSPLEMIERPDLA